jgi:Nucleotidyl transferase AbiEii toxin, Type IV TA system
VRPTDEELAPLRMVADHLAELRDDAVFVGGAVIPLLLTDAGAPPTRVTDDVDLVVRQPSGAAYAALGARLRQLGFHEDSREGAPLCRWTVDKIVVDIMPTDPAILGFSNAWYEHAVDTAVVTPIAESPRATIRVVSASTFIATKLDAFASRGKGEWTISHDIEDVIAVTDGRPSLVAEVEADTEPLRRFVAEHLTALIDAGVEDIVRAHLPSEAASDERAPFVVCSIRRLARMARVARMGEMVRVPSADAPSGAWEHTLTHVQRIDADRGSLDTLMRDAMPLRSDQWPPRSRVPNRRHTDFLAVFTVSTNRPPEEMSADAARSVLEDASGAEYHPSPVAIVADERPAVVKMVSIYNVPKSAAGLRLRLPFNAIEIPVDS